MKTRTVLLNYTGRKCGGRLEAYEAAKEFKKNNISVVTVFLFMPITFLNRESFHLQIY